MRFGKQGYGDGAGAAEEGVRTWVGMRGLGRRLLAVWGGDAAVDLGLIGLRNTMRLSVAVAEVGAGVLWSRWVCRVVR